MPLENNEDWMINPENVNWLTFDEDDDSLQAQITKLDIEVKKEDPFLEVMARANDIFTRYASGELVDSPSGQALTFENDETNSIWTLSRKLVGEPTNNQISLTLIIDPKDKVRSGASIADVAYYLGEDSTLIPPSVTSNGLLDAELVVFEGGASVAVKATNFLLLLDTIDEELSLK